MKALSATAHARAGLLGNPSDGYGGKAIALALADFRARVHIEAAPRFELVTGPTDGVVFPDARAAAEHFAAIGCEDGLRLLRAALRQLAARPPGLGAIDADDPRLRFRMRYETDIPRQVGLAGSSAIVVAALRALCGWFELEIPPAELAEMALAAELQDLGIAAGAMDRVVQAHGGLVLMDLAEPRSADSYQAIDPKRLPPLFIAWDPRGGQASGRSHGPVRARWLAGDPEVLAMVEAYRKLVDEGAACLRDGNVDGLRELMNRNFEMRTRVFDVSSRDRALVAVARDAGGAAKLCGSGGAVVGMSPPGDSEPGLAALERSYRDAGFSFLRPTVALPVS